MLHLTNKETSPPAYSLRRRYFLHILLTIWIFSSGFTTFGFTSFVEKVDHWEIRGVDPERIVRNFELIAFGNEYTGEQFTHVRKWKEPVRLGIQGKYPPHFEKQVVSFAKDLTRITGHKVELYYSFAMQKEKRLPKNFDPKKVNVILFYLPTADIPKHLAKYYQKDPPELGRMVANSTCFAKFYRRKNEITKAIVVFPDHHGPDIMRACVVEELAQIMGLPNDSSEVKPSIFSDTSLYRELTEHDKLLLRILYDKKIKANMPREEALDVARSLLQEWRKK